MRTIQIKLTEEELFLITQAVIEKRIKLDNSLESLRLNNYSETLDNYFTTQKAKHTELISYLKMKQDS